LEEEDVDRLLTYTQWQQASKVEEGPKTIKDLFLVIRDKLLHF
jgi:hypothetical protein